MGDFNIKYGTWSDYTITAASLASSATLVAGRESTAVSNTTNLFLDYHIGGKITTGTTPTAGTIEIWAYANIGGDTTYPDVFDGTDSAETLTFVGLKSTMLGLVAQITTDATSDQTYWVRPVSLVRLFGHVPNNHGLFLTHNTVAALNATGTNHKLSYRGIELNTP